MRNLFSNIVSRNGGKSEKHINQIEEPDPLQELVYVIEDDEPLTNEEIDAIGELGNRDDGDAINQMRDQAAMRAPTRMALLMTRAAQSLSALRSLRSTSMGSDDDDRVPEEHWRALADEALGLIEPEVSKEASEQSLMRAMPAKEREEFQKLCDSRRGIAVFRKAFDEERAAWEKEYWRRALDESFNKRHWTGPGGWRSFRESNGRAVLDTGSKTASEADFANLACRAAKASTAPSDAAGLGADANPPSA